ncbi:MAG: LLM class flavin-dependent oxidoreductase [Dehalococcoidia bacterium]
MKFGASVSSYTTTWEEIQGAMKTMDSGRWSSIWFPDHFIPPAAWKGAEDQPIFESWTLLAAVAGMTNTLRMGHMVNGNTYRNPGLVAKMATTIDQISNGRFVLSVGAAMVSKRTRSIRMGFLFSRRAIK